MWLLKAPSAYSNITGELFGQQFVNGVALISTQYYWQLLTYKGFLDVTPKDWKHLKPEKLERVLFVHHGGIGDVLFISTVAKAYKKKFPDTKIHLATNFNASQLFKNNFSVDGFVIDRQQEIGHLIEQYDDILCFDAAIAGNSVSTIENVYDIYLQWAGLETDDKLPEIVIPEEEKTRLKVRLSNDFKIKEADKIAVIQFESTTAIRNIEWEKFIELADRLEKDGYTVLLFGQNSAIKDAMLTTCKCGRKNETLAGPNIVQITRKCSGCGKEIKTITETDKLIGRDKKIFFLEGYSIYEIATIVSLSSYFIGVDSCGLHIAGALNIPVLGIFSSFEGDLRMRYYNNARWIQKPYRCAPCFIHHIPCRWMVEGNLSVPPCMTQITVDEIYGEFNKLVKCEPFDKPKPFQLSNPGACPVCKSDGAKFLTRKGQVCYYQCKECDTVYCGAKIQTEFYQEADYWPTYKKEGYVEGQIELARMITDNYAKDYNYQGSVLELGCAKGDCLAELNRLGWRIKGVEISNEFKEEYVKKRIPVSIGSFETMEITDKFDVVLLKDVFEHFADPVFVLMKMAHILTDKGIIVIFSPDTDYWNKFNNKWGHINTNFPGEHNVLLNKKSLEVLAKNTSMTIKSFTKMDASESFWGVLSK